MTTKGRTVRTLMSNMGKICLVGDCEVPAYCRQKCRAHYRAEYKKNPYDKDLIMTDRYSPVISRLFTGPPRFRPEVEKMLAKTMKDPLWDPYTNPLSFWAVRHLVASLWGSPEDHSCHFCWREPASAITYDFKDPMNEIREVIRRAYVVYSPDPAFYSPACRSCVTELRETYAAPRDQSQKQVHTSAVDE